MTSSRRSRPPTAVSARVMGILLHPMITGQPLRANYLKRALTEMKKDDRAWFATGSEIIDACEKANPGGVNFHPHGEERRRRVSNHEAPIRTALGLCMWSTMPRGAHANGLHFLPGNRGATHAGFLETTRDLFHFFEWQNVPHWDWRWRVSNQEFDVFIVCNRIGSDSD
jgi:hypothetical protein